MLRGQLPDGRGDVISAIDAVGTKQIGEAGRLRSRPLRRHVAKHALGAVPLVGVLVCVPRLADADPQGQDEQQGGERRREVPRFGAYVQEGQRRHGVVAD